MTCPKRSCYVSAPRWMGHHDDPPQPPPPLLPRAPLGTPLRRRVGRALALRAPRRRRRRPAARGPALPPFACRAAAAAGRPVRDPRGRLDAIFWLAANTRPGRAPPPW